MFNIGQALTAVDWSTVSIPPLGESAQRLLSLDEESRNEPRMLALFAQQDPVLLGKVLSLANSAAVRPINAAPIVSLDGAIRVLGVTTTYTTMLAVLLDSSLGAYLEPLAVRRFLTKNSFTRWSTGVSLCRLLNLSGEDVLVVQLGALLEPLGIYVALLDEDGVGKEVLFRIEEAIRLQKPVSTESCGLTGYAEMSAKVAEQWGAPPRVVQAVAQVGDGDAALMRALGAVIAAKVNGASQIEALTTTLEESPGAPRPRAKLQIDIVSFD